MKGRIYFQRKLFYSIAANIIVFTIILAFVFYWYTYHNTLINNMNTSKQVAGQFVMQIDELFHAIDYSCMSIICNTKLRGDLETLNFDQPINQMEQYNFAQDFKNNLSYASYYLPNISKIAVFNSNKKFYYYAGLSEDSQKAILRNLSDLEWYNSLVGDTENYSIIGPHKSEWSENGRLVVSFYKRIFPLPYKYQLGTVEVQIPYTDFEKMIQLNSSQIKIVIYSKSGDIVYPYSVMNKDREVYNDMYHNVSKKVLSTDDFLSSHSTKRYMYESKKSQITGWTVLAITDKSLLNQSMYFFIFMIFIFAIFLIILINSAFYLITKKLTIPLRKLMQNVMDTDLADADFIDYVFSKDEFEYLENAFKIIRENLQKSTNKIAELRIQQNKAHYMALQAKMNPHFLYNAINSISAACEIYDGHVAAEMCGQLADIIRYTSNDDEQLVTFSEELYHVSNYLEFMKTSYVDSLDYQLDISPDVLEMKLPRHTLQPLVENCFSHGFSNVIPPWSIHIIAHPEKEGWSAEIIDNGKGFGEEAIRRLDEQMKYYDAMIASGDFKNDLQIKGMGLMNVYNRLAILTKGYSLITVHDFKTRGCSVKIRSNTDLQ